MDTARRELLSWRLRSKPNSGCKSEPKYNKTIAVHDHGLPPLWARNGIATGTASKKKQHSVARNVAFRLAEWHTCEPGLKNHADASATGDNSRLAAGVASHAGAAGIFDRILK